MTSKEQRLPIFREGALGMKEFYKLSYVDKNKYIKYLLTLEPNILGDCDRHILKFHSIQPEKNTVDNFFSL
jgi:glutamate-1-semialdehyde aminotransferase